MSEPVVIRCPFCEEPVALADDPYPLPMDIEGRTLHKLAHRECLLRSVIGSVGHQMGVCHCTDRIDTSEAGLTPREAARRAVAYYRHKHKQEE